MPVNLGRPGIELTQTNVNILKSITPQIVKEAPNAKYIIVSNPVDIMTYVFTKISGLSENQIMGSGTILDTARLHMDFPSTLKLHREISMLMYLSEHGDTSFIPWTSAYISGLSTDEYYEEMKAYGKEIEPFGQRSYAGICTEIRRKSYCKERCDLLCSICNCLSAGWSDSGCLLIPLATVSSMLHGEYGIEDVCLSTLTL